MEKIAPIDLLRQITFTNGIYSFYKSILVAANKLLGCNYSSLWLFNKLNDSLTLGYIVPDNFPFRNYENRVIKIENALNLWSQNRLVEKLNEMQLFPDEIIKIIPPGSPRQIIPLMSIDDCTGYLFVS